MQMHLNRIGSAIVMGFHYTKDHPCPGTREENQHCQVGYLPISFTYLFCSFVHSANVSPEVLPPLI